MDKLIMKTNDLTQIKSKSIFFELKNFLRDNMCYLKLEGLNIAGSIKLTSALSMINALEEQSAFQGTTKPTIVCSSSGNFGVSVAMVCKQRGYHAVVISDPNISSHYKHLIQAMGAQIVTITQKDKNGGYLINRLAYAKALIAQRHDYFWLNQYENISNVAAHYNHTAKEIAGEFPKIDYIFVGVGTSGTLMGIANYFKQTNTKIIAVDAQGSVSFKRQPSKRYIPGIGSSKRAALLDESIIDDLVIVKEIDSIKQCHSLVNQYGLLVGGSTGSVCQAMYQYANQLKPKATIVAISADFGHAYLDTIYNHAWVAAHYHNHLFAVNG